MTTRVFGTKIFLQDHRSPVVENTNIGLYNVDSDLTANANADQKVVAVADGTKFESGEILSLTDDDNTEECVIDSISVNNLTMLQNLKYSYTTTKNAEVTGDSVFKWIQNDISGVTNWKSGIIVSRGMSSWSRNINLFQGGNTALNCTFTVKVKNTNKFWNTINLLNIYMNGLRCEIFYFEDTTPTRKWCGICELPTWDARAYTIPSKGFKNQRIANITVKVDSTNTPNAVESIGTAIPTTWGCIKPVFDEYGNQIYKGYAKFPRVEDKVQVYRHSASSIINTDSNVEMRIDEDLLNCKIFPVVEVGAGDTPTTYNIKLGNAGQVKFFINSILQVVGTYNFNFFNNNDLENIYIRVVKGTGGEVLRKVTAASITLSATPDDWTILSLTIQDIFEETLVGNATATAENQTWINILKANRVFKVDEWKCKDFLDENGIVVSENLSLYSYSSNEKVKVSGSAETVNIESEIKNFFQLPGNSYKIKNTNKKNSIEIDGSHYEKELDRVNSFLFLPPTKISLYDANDLDDLGLENYARYYDGLYRGTSGSGNKFSVTNDAQTGSVDSVIDRNYVTYFQRYLTLGTIANTHWRHVFKLELPDLPYRYGDNFQIYFGIQLYCGWTNFVQQDPSYINIRNKAFIGACELSLDKQDLEDNVDGNLPENLLTIDNTADFYFTKNKPSRNNERFYKSVDDSGTMMGYENGLLGGIDTREKYERLQKNCFLTIRRIYDFGTDFTFCKDLIKLHNIYIAFKKVSSIKSAIYAPFQGRVFNDTWNGRKSAPTLMQSPPDLMESLCRLQCYPDCSPAPTMGWGRDYALGAKINIGSTGYDSFDNTVDPNFTILKSYKAARQVLKYEENSTNKLKQSLCKDFFLANWVNKDKQECINRIIKSETSPSETINFSDLVNENKFKIREPNPADIFPEPFVNYRMNNANGKFEGYKGITNVDALNYDSTYSKGITGATGEELWNKCNTLWNKVKHLETPPTYLTDKLWFNGEDADQMAIDYLFNWIDWMSNPNCEFYLDYVTCKDWEETHRFNLQMPHQTNNAILECLLYKVTFDPNPPNFVKCNAIIFRDSIPEDFRVKDTWINYGNEHDWKDTWINYGNDYDKKDTM